MIVVCEECGRRYRVDVDKMKGKVGKAYCHACDHLIVVTRPVQEEMISFEDFSESNNVSAPHMDEISYSETHEETPPPEKPQKKEKRTRKEESKSAKFKTKGFGLTIKMLILFFFIPILLMIGASILYFWQLNNLSSLITKESSDIVTKMAEETIAENARSVAAQVRLYILGHPDLKAEDLSNDAEFQKIAVQKVGKTGYTALHTVPDKDGIMRNWAHVNPKIIGMDMSKLKGPLGAAFPSFWKVFSTGKGGKESKGYYTWQDADKSFREKFMVCTPVTGTRYYIASTTYLDEFTTPVKNLEKKARAITTNTRNINIAILVCTLILVGFVVSWYGLRLTRKIKYLTDVAERISIGELDAEISLKATDEIGELRDAISRMQDSIRISIERLRQRR
ncbi:MAG TPA: zinc-ribbon domain-containing protein [Desulfobacteraceae bacterium]|nr:zinc-ribbon domain-containing protein [Desulfobacteraceae bacterium]HPJ67194.1 zinc-ribbon domain-containing protein [Desulfobacteraceae bacterium]HPQ26854.1 zinc-ribbon domain-containing protein [Desulfobacteraceae bacterium]